MRASHFLKGNKARSYPSRIVLFDTETRATSVGPYAQRHELRLGVACHWRRRTGSAKDTFDWITFTRPEEFWDWLISKVHKDTRTLVVSHNLGFDLPILEAFSWLPTLGFKLRAFYSKGLTTLVRVRGLGATLEFVDNTNFYRERLEDLGEVVGVPKLAVDFTTALDRELEVYCRRDVEILVKLWERWFDFLEVHDLGQWYRTLPSQSFGAYRHRFLDYPILIHNHERALDLERQTYHGGRTEVFRVGAYAPGPFYKLDVNSMYPYVMHAEDYPTCLRGYKESANLAMLRKRLERYLVIAEARIRTKDPAFVVHQDGHALYPIGEYWTVLTTNELRHVLEHGEILDVGSLAWYSRAPIFRSYVEYFYELKRKYTENGNTTFRRISKGFLNFLYGKFGQRGLEDTLLGECDPGEFKILECVEPESHAMYDLIYIGGQVIRREHTNESYNSFPAIAAHVTANARLYLYHLITVAGRDQVYYIDTDSLIVDPVGYERLSEYLDNTELGALKLEGSTDRIEIRAPKDYTFGPHQRIKGIRGNATQIAPASYRQDKFPSIQGLLRSAQSHEYIVTQQVKTLNRVIHSGVVGADGRVTPFAFGAPPRELF